MMNNQVIKTYSKRRPVAFFKTESRLVPSISERISKMRESRLNDKTLVIDNFDDTFDRLALDVLVPSPKNSLDVEQNDIFDDTLFKIAQQTQKTYRKNYKKDRKLYDKVEPLKDNLSSKKQREKIMKKAVSSKDSIVKRKRINSDNDNEDVNEKMYTSDSDEKTGKDRDLNKRNKNNLNKKRKLSLTTSDNKNEVKLKECTIPLERFNPNTSIDQNKLNTNEHNTDKENVNETNDNLFSTIESKKQTGYLTSTPRYQKKSLCITMHHNISPIVLNKESLEKTSPNKLIEINVNRENNSIVKINNSKSNISDSMFKNTSLSINDCKKSHKDSYSKQSPIVLLNVDDKSLKVNKVNHNSCVESPLLFGDSQNSQINKSNKHKTVSFIKVKNLSKSINVSFNNFTKIKKPFNHQNDSKKNIHPNVSTFYESSYIPDDWTNDYNSSYEYFTEKDNDNLHNYIENKKNGFNDLPTKRIKISRLSYNTRNKGSSSKIDINSKNNTILETTANNFDQSVVNSSVFKENNCENKSKDDKITKQLYVVVPKLNHEDIIDQVPAEKETEKNKVSDLKRDEENVNDIESEFCNNLLSTRNPIRVTIRRNLKKKSDKALKVIAEDFVESSSNIIEEVDDIVTSNPKISNTDKSLRENFLVDNDEHENLLKFRESHPIFLKPGKSWARSLSIINHFHNGQDLDELAIGRGKHWRQSVRTVLNMQPDNGIIQVNDRESEGKMSIPKDIRNRVSLFPTVSIPTSPNRYSRFSIVPSRIVPSGKRSTLTSDFLDTDRKSSIASKTRKTSVSRKTSLKICRDNLIETEEDLIKSAKDIILKRCNQTSYVRFDDCFPNSYTDHCRKIGEGVYGEVFFYAKDDKKSVIKIIPIEGDQLVNCEPQKKFHEILSEIIISEELHKLKLGDVHNTYGFIGINRIMCVIGKYPDKLINLWKTYDEEKKSENDCPDMFDDQQLYIILELAHGGQDLESYNFQNASESYSIFLQTAYSLAIAEKSLEFEHRDLHWGNILISKTNETKSCFKLNNNEIILPTKGVKVSVIDFTLSRLSYKGCKIYNDLALDPTLFQAQGEYQFDIYRMMRDSISNDWQQFNPYTNILWLDYTLDKMITKVRYKKKTTKVHKNAISQMKELRKTILNYKSAYDFVNNCEKITV